MTEPRRVADVFRWIARDPWDALGRRWNYKSAIFSALTRASIFFTVNLSAGWRAATGAMLAELAFRLTTAGFYGALTQAFRQAEPRALATACAMILLPAVAHSLEFGVHFLRGTPALAASIAASLAMTAISTSFNLFAMRHGALIVGDGQRSVIHDLAAMPRLVILFVAALVRLR